MTIVYDSVARKAIFLVWVAYSHAQTVSFQNFKTLASIKVKEELIYRMTGYMSLIKCTALCAIDDDCKSASHNSNEGWCHLTSHNITGSKVQDGLLVDLNWRTISRFSLSGCADGWTKLGLGCYKVNNTEGKNCSEAEIYCKQEGGRLAEPRTISEFELVRMFLREQHNNPQLGYWFGLADLKGDDSFVWKSNGEVPEYAAWVDNEPSNRHGEDFAYLNTRNDFKWADFFCDRRTGTLCDI